MHRFKHILNLFSRKYIYITCPICRIEQYVTSNNIKKDNNTKEECCICMENNSNVQLICNHTAFCLLCIKKCAERKFPAYEYNLDLKIPIKIVNVSFVSNTNKQLFEYQINKYQTWYWIKTTNESHKYFFYDTYKRSEFSLFIQNLNKRKFLENKIIQIVYKT